MQQSSTLTPSVCKAAGMASDEPLCAQDSSAKTVSCGGRMLLVCRGGLPGSTEGDQVQGFAEYAAALEVQFGLVCQRVEALSVDGIERAVETHPADIAVIMLSWAVTPEDAVTLFQRLKIRHPAVKFVFLDYYAPTSSPHFGVLPYVDRYIKRQVLRDRDLYQADYLGGTYLTDYLARKLHFRLEDWQFGVKPNPTLMHKVVKGWNFGVTRRNRQLLRLSRMVPLPWKHRPIAIHRRIGLNYIGGKAEWCQQYRALGLERLEPLAKSYRSTGVDRISRKRFQAEMMLSKIAFSPFGWGELCFRDYEAVCCGALLIKPSMSHLETSPDIFREFETYVPIRWDFSDLEATCDYYLSHPQESAEIVNNAQQVMRRYFQQDGFLSDIRRCLELPA